VQNGFNLWSITCTYFGNLTYFIAVLGNQTLHNGEHTSCKSNWTFPIYYTFICRKLLLFYLQYPLFMIYDVTWICSMCLLVS